MIEQKLKVELTETAFLVKLWEGNATRYYAYRPYNNLHGVVLALVPDEASGEKPEYMLYLKEDQKWVATQSKTRKLLREYEHGTREVKAFELIFQEAQRYANGSLN